MTLLSRGVADLFPAQLDTSKLLRVKLGIDPTKPDLHLGHTVALRKLRQFQDQGHVAVLIIGDFTARIGDPTGKSEMRPRLTETEVEYNAQTYLDQARKILDFAPQKLEVHYNSQWLASLDLQKIIEIMASMTLQQMLAKEGFRERYERQNPIYLHEFLYPLLQGYDSVAIRSDVEIGGTDQKFNIAVGRDLQALYAQPQQTGLLVPLLVGLDGVQKMSKSLDNYVGLTDEPMGMYQKLEKVPDALVESYFELLTEQDLTQLPTNPRERQRLLAQTIVTQFYGEAVAQQVQQDAQNLSQGALGEVSDQLPEFSITELEYPLKLFQVLSLSGLCPSNNEARRQIQGGAVKLNGEKVSDPNLEFSKPAEIKDAVLQVGKKKIIRLAYET
ncbi:MAG: tyrosine--tRNA ligase [Gloeobacterales cyanobacterium]